MKNPGRIFCIFILVLMACNSQPASRSHNLCTENSDYFEAPELYAWVNDHADILADTAEIKLNALLKSLEDSVGSQLVILTIDSLGDRSIEQYSIKVADQWKIGRANYDDGIIITLAMKDRKIRIEVGYGLELIIRDEIAKRIINNTMVPRFREGNFYYGLRDASEEIMDLIYRNAESIGKKWEPTK